MKYIELLIGLNPIASYQLKDNVSNEDILEDLTISLEYLRDNGSDYIAYMVNNNIDPILLSMLLAICMHRDEPILAVNINCKFYYIDIKDYASDELRLEMYNEYGSNIDNISSIEINLSLSNGFNTKKVCKVIIDKDDYKAFKSALLRGYRELDILYIEIAKELEIEVTGDSTIADVFEEHMKDESYRYLNITGYNIDETITYAINHLTDTPLTNTYS